MDRFLNCLSIEYICSIASLSRSFKNTEAFNNRGNAIFHALARQKECQIIEGHLMPDHVHMCIAIPRSTRWHR
jgi:REP element-mobilizing transposase RayT